MYQGRTFNTEEDALKTWAEDAEKAFAKLPKSGVYCRCECYRWNDNARKEPLRTCELLLPEEEYRSYERFTSKEDKGIDSKAHVAVIRPGRIRVRFYPPEKVKENYGVEQELCGRRERVDEFLGEYLGKKIRLGKNLLAKSKKPKGE